ncbi:MAG: GNAT family N-acetyltransferase [Myxococcales bacterium]|nr:GNAT family N-acetyltransferase [Myxococcales bacterium]
MSTPSDGTTNGARLRRWGKMRGSPLPRCPPRATLASMPRVHFQPDAATHAPAAEAYIAHAHSLAALLPWADIQHVGATSVPGLSTKGDLDICVRVPAERFAAADLLLARVFERNVGSGESATFTSFKDDDQDMPLGVQLCVAGGPEDFFVRLRDVLRSDAHAAAGYARLKRRHEGGDMDAYRADKTRWIETLLGIDKRWPLPITLRPVGRADVGAAIDLVARVLGEFALTFGDGSSTDLQMRALPQSYVEAGGMFWVALSQSGHVVGTCGVYPVAPATLELRKMYVEPELRGRGVGARLLAEAVAFARAHGTTRLVLDTTEQMKAAIAFYEMNGFVRDDAQVRGERCSRGYSMTL